jgi:hypothetical protein
LSREEAYIIRLVGGLSTEKPDQPAEKGAKSAPSRSSFRVMRRLTLFLLLF